MAFKGSSHHHHHRHRGASTMRRANLFALVTVGAIGVGAVTSGCSDEPSGPNPESMQVVGVRSIHNVRVNDSYVAPDGSAWIYRGENDELCVGLHAEPDAEPMCAPWDHSMSANGVSWSADAKRVLFTEDFYVRYDESDVSMFDVDAGRIEVLTQDDADDIEDDRAETDIFPFFGPDEEVFFFRYRGSDRSFALYQLVDGQVEAVEGGQLPGGWLPQGPPFASGNNAWTFGYSEGSRPAGYATLTFEGSGADAKVSMDELWEPGDPAVLTDVVGGTLLVSRYNRGDDTNASVVIPDERASVDLIADDQEVSNGFSVPGARLSADGKHVLELRRTGDGMSFTLWRLETDGDTLTAEPTPVGTVTDDRLGAGVGELPGMLGWDGGTTLTAIGRAGLVVFDVTLDEE